MVKAVDTNKRYLYEKLVNGERVTKECFLTDRSLARILAQNEIRANQKIKAPIIYQNIRLADAEVKNDKKAANKAAEKPVKEATVPTSNELLS